MAYTVMHLRRAAGRSEAVGLAGVRTPLPLAVDCSGVADKLNGSEVHIDWQPVLAATTRGLGGTKPTYKSIENKNGMLEETVSFTIPLDSQGLKIESICVTGRKCFFPSEAESEAAAAALRYISSNVFGIKIMDVSQSWCDDIKLKASRLLAKAGDIHRAVQNFLSDWNECTRLVVEVACRHRNIEVQKALLVGTRANMLEQSDLFISSEGARADRWHLHFLTTQYCEEHDIQKMVKQRGKFLDHLMIPMKIVLSEMISSLCWTAREYTVTVDAGIRYKAGIQLNTDYSYVPKVFIEGGWESSDEEAIEDAAKAAIKYIEHVFSIYLIDLNYNKRLDAELLANKSEKAMNDISSISTKAKAGWERLLTHVGVCAAEASKIATADNSKDPPSGDAFVIDVNDNSVVRLHEDCQVEFLFACARHDRVSTSVSVQYTARKEPGVPASGDRS